jgi:methylenetetrahydrofolate dehydrogenase (NADP+)/methenyltetrahydrofolate cyclohydrolase/formyltetrahydrofolate synthetase
VSNHWAEGGAGARALAEAVVATCEGPSGFNFLYDLSLPIEEKIAIISKDIYGADGIQLSELARKQIETYTRQGYNDLPSKSTLRLSQDVSLTQCSMHGKDAVLFLSRSET